MIRFVIFSIVCLLSCKSTKSQSYTVSFKVDLNQEKAVSSVSLRGSINPLSWEKDYPLTDKDGDGIYETTINLHTEKRFLQYKFLVNGNYELVGDDKRSLRLTKQAKTVEHVFNQLEYYNQDELAELTLTPSQIQEDIDILKKTLAYIHPNLHAYRTEKELEQDYQTLKSEMLAVPTIPNAYKAISKFATNIQCSHTFTNPWNQGSQIKTAVFNQPDKIPFTFSRIGKKIFIDKNASENEKLKPGIEVLKINGFKTADIMTKLAAHVTSDGSNYEKRLQRLTLEGDEKYSLFDIFFSLEYGIQDTFSLELLDHSTKQTFTTSVKSISKTSRSKILKDRYNSFNQVFKDNWEFKTIENNVAYLRINSFAVFNKNFDWKNFIDEAFSKINNRESKHLIIDIRKNEGGYSEVAEYILSRIISQAIKVEAAKSITAYKKIPNELKQYISTWDKMPYNFGMKVKKMKDGKYELRKLFAGKTKTYKAHKSGYRGKTYLLTSAQNSSATHLMAAYVKRYNLATIIGQTTGGNQRGLNGGQMFFHKLPNSKVEIDIPIFGITTQEVNQSTPNGGIEPDIKVVKNIPDLVARIDTELNTALNLIKNSSTYESKLTKPTL